MTISTRWHKTSCDAPQVVVDGNVPECRACGSSALALLQKAAEEPAPSYSGIKLPPESPIGQMDLWWPPCVPYTRNGAPRAQPRASSGDAASLAPQTWDSSLSEIYTSTLGQDHFRLLYISGASAIDSPIHGNLVEYERENCPEYETASYTWGGEDGDATPCRPAYFGNFWDVLFLTRNCWSLLQYLRPQMGTRVVWVDAICINQNNIPERGAQVSIMTQIYKNCLRVVIFPGDHLVRKDEHRFRKRIKHDDIIERDGLYYVNNSSSDIWHSVFQSRYISRVWVIQELILAPAAILALDDHDLYLDNHLLHRVSRKDSGREWLEFMGQGYKLCQKTLYEVLKMTFDSQATDPRDKIFGILGILGPNPTYSGIVPEYSLSLRDCIIGAIGLTLIISKEFWPLLAVQNSSTISQYPSWLPSLDEIASRTDNASQSSLVARFINDEMPEEWPTIIKLGEYDSARNSQMNDRYYPKFMPWGGSDTEGNIEQAGLTERQLVLVGPEISWNQDASIDSASGALTLRLVRLFDTPQELVERSYIRTLLENQALGVLIKRKVFDYHVKGPSSEAVFDIKMKPPKLERPCHLFLAFRVKSPHTQENSGLLSSKLGNTETYLLFADEAEDPEKFKLLACRRLDAAMFCSATRILPRYPYLHSQGTPGVYNILSLFDVLHQVLNYKPQEQLKKLDESEVKFFDLIIPGQEAIIPEYSQLVLAVARTGESAGATEEFRRAYTICLQSRSGEFNPVLDHEYVWFTLVENDALGHFEDGLFRHLPHNRLSSGPGRYLWDEIFPPWFELQIPEINDTHFANNGCVGVPSWPDIRRCGQHKDFGLEGRVVLSHWLPCAPEPKKLELPLKAKMSLREIMMGIRETKLHWLLRCLLAFGEKLSEDAQTLLERGPQPEDSNIYLHQEWPRSLVDELDFVWRSEMVTFV